MVKKTLLDVNESIIRETLYDPVRTEWKPHDTVEHSGVYEVFHGDDHLMFSGKRYPERHQVICLAGQIFPECNRCGTRPRFTLSAFGEPIGQNVHFK
jgi:hypothetical protein